jgi:hypothetical protein
MGAKERARRHAFIFLRCHIFDGGRGIGSEKETRLCMYVNGICSKIGPIEKILVGGLDAWSWVKTSQGRYSRPDLRLRQDPF